MFSLDGPKEVHDKNRIFAGSNRGSFEKLRDSMKMIYSMDRKYYKKNVSFNTVLDPQNELRTINEQISNFAQTYPTNLKASSNEALLFMRRYRFANCSCFSCCFKDAYPSSNVQ